MERLSTNAFHELPRYRRCWWSESILLLLRRGQAKQPENLFIQSSWSLQIWPISLPGGSAGSTSPNFPKANTFFAWCVRGGQGVDPQ